MRSQLHRLAVSTGLAAATLLGTAGSSPAPPRAERVERRPGMVWVAGRWDWRDGNWVWIDGRFERERHGKRWREARWEHRDGAYVLVDGDWIDGASSRFPVEAPPAPRAE